MALKIVDLPIEMIMEILSHVNNRMASSRVCKLFYDAANKLNSSNFTLRLKKQDFLSKGNQKFENIMGTTRTVEKIEIFMICDVIKPEVLIKINALMKKFSSSIKWLKFSGDLQLIDFMAILALAPNVNTLVLDFIHLPKKDEQPSKKKRRSTPNENTLNLYQLNSLSLDSCEKEFEDIFNRLPAGVLTEINLDTEHIDTLKEMFKKQQNIKKLTLNLSSEHSPRLSTEIFHFPKNLLDKHKLEYLEIDLKFHATPLENSFLNDILIKQKSLKTLKVLGRLSTGTMDLLVQNPNLEVLVMHVPYMSVEVFKKISKLEKLYDLTLQSNEDRNQDHFIAFSELDNSRITTLDIQYVYDIPDELIAAIAHSVPNLKVLRFNCPYNYKTFHAVMKNFNHIEEMDLNTGDTEFEPYDLEGSSNDLMGGGCTNKNLKVFNLTYSIKYTTGFIKKMIKDYPNIRKLIIQPFNEITKQQLELIMKGFQKLESFRLTDGSGKLKIQDLEVINEYGKSLRFISLYNIRITKFNKKDVQKMFKNMFDIIMVTNEELKMASDAIALQTVGKY